jgi:hypothetical protein
VLLLCSLKLGGVAEHSRTFHYTPRVAYSALLFEAFMTGCTNELALRRRVAQTLRRSQSCVQLNQCWRTIGKVKEREIVGATGAGRGVHRATLPAERWARTGSVCWLSSQSGSLATS